MTSKFSDLSSRVGVAVVAIPLILFASWYGGLYFFTLVLGIALLSLKEFYDLARLKEVRPQYTVGMIATIFLHAAFFHEQLHNSMIPLLFGSAGAPVLTKLQLLITVLLVSAVIVLVVELFRNKGSLFSNAGYTIFGIVYIGLFLAAFVGIRELFGMEFPFVLAQTHNPEVTVFSDLLHTTTYSWGGLTIIAILASVWMCDTAAYFGGLSMGRHKLMQRVSPKKSWEGAVWGFIASVITMIVFQSYWLPYLKLHQAIVLGILIGTFGQIGDLVESLLKRDSGVKDSSSLIPGHGGVLDRFDSIIFLSPILYIYIDFFILS